MSHHNTIFSQILKLVPRHEFSSLSKKHDGKRRSDAMSRCTMKLTMAQADIFTAFYDVTLWGGVKSFTGLKTPLGKNVIFKIITRGLSPRNDGKVILSRN